MDRPHGEAVVKSLCIERTEALLVVSTQNMAGCYCLFCDISVFMHLLSHMVFYNLEVSC